MSLILLLAALQQPVSVAASPRDAAGASILIENEGARSIYNLFSQPLGSRRWGDDRLEDATIPPRRSRSVVLRHRPGRCHYRLKLVLADRSTRLRTVDLCRGGRWVITDSGDRFDPSAPAHVRD